MILTEAEIKNLMTTYHGNEAFVIGVAVGKSIEAHKAKRAFCKAKECVPYEECHRANGGCFAMQRFIKAIEE